MNGSPLRRSELLPAHLDEGILTGRFGPVLTVFSMKSEKLGAFPGRTGGFLTLKLGEVLARGVRLPGTLSIGE